MYSADKVKLSFHCSSASRQTWRLHFSFSWCSSLLTAPTQKKEQVKVRKTMRTPTYPYLLTPTLTVIPFVTTYSLRNSVFFTFNKSETVWSNFANVLTFLKTSDVTPRNLYCKIWLDSSPIFSLGDKTRGESWEELFASGSDDTPHYTSRERKATERCSWALPEQKMTSSSGSWVRYQTYNTPLKNCSCYLHFLCFKAKHHCIPWCSSVR